MRRVLAVLLGVAGSLACQGGSLSVKLAPALEGFFRPGAPLWLRVSVANEGSGFEGSLDIAVEGVVYRQPIRVGGATVARAEALVVARSQAARARVMVRSRAGEVLYEGDAGLGLAGRTGATPLVLSVGSTREAGQLLFKGCQVALTAGELSGLAAAYAAVDALTIEGDGGDVPAAARSAIPEWVRGGGVVGFALAAGAAVRTDSLLAELGGCAGRASAEEWLAAVQGRQRARATEGGLAWRSGLGVVAAGTREKLGQGAFAGLLRPEPTGDEWADRRLYSAFRGARWDAAVRWRLVGGAIALLVGGALVAQWGLRRRGRALRAAAAVGVVALLVGVSWGVMLPSGRGTLEGICVLERAAGQPGERRTEVVCLEALGRTRVRLDFGSAEAVVPFLHGAEDSGGGDGAVIERDAAGRWTVECALTRRTRRCFGAWWPWREAAPAEPAGVQRGDLLVRGGRSAAVEEPGKVPDGPWRPLDELAAWGDGHRALAQWQGRRVGATRLYRIRREEPWRSMVAGEGVLEERRLAAQVWTLAED